VESQRGLSGNNARCAGTGEKGGNHKADNFAQSNCKRLEKEKMENITIYTGVVECDYHELAEEFIKSASDALSMSKKESKGR
jgi:hypothetical protein